MGCGVIGEGLLAKFQTEKESELLRLSMGKTTVTQKVIVERASNI